MNIGKNIVMAVVFVCCTAVFIFPAARAEGCDPAAVIEKYGEDENTYKYRRRENLRDEISALLQSCGDSLGDADVTALVELVYEYGVFEEARPLADRMRSMDMETISNAAMAHALYSGDSEFTLQLMKLQVKLLRKTEARLSEFRVRSGREDIVSYLKMAAQFEADISLKRRGLGLLLMNYGDFDAAVTEYGIVMEDQPGFWITPAQLGTRYLETGDLDRAEFFSKYSLSRKDSARAYSNLAQVSILRGDISDAERYARKLEDVSESFASLGYGRLDLLEGNYRDAYNNFMSFFDTSPCVTRYWNHAPLFAAARLLGRLLEGQGGVPARENLAETAAALEAEGDFSAAASHYYLLTMLDPRNPEYHYRLGRINQTLAHPLSAVRAYSLHLHLNPGSPYAPEINNYFDTRMIDYAAIEN